MATSDPLPLVPVRPRRRTRLVVAAAVLVFLVAAVAVFFVLAGPDADDPMSRVEDCRVQVKEQMKAPATTKFPGGETVRTAHKRATVAGEYDSENEFGAMIRGHYECFLVQDDGGDGYRVMRVDVLD